jgi:uncharacterized protein YdaU (DUF1376 family)
MNYYERHLGDYIRDTVSLTMLQDGAYTRLLDQLYQSETPLPLDRKLLYRVARAATAAERKAVDYMLEAFFTCGDAGFTQKRAMEEIAHVREKLARGKRNADSRWSKQRVQALLDPNPACEIQANPHANPDAKAMQNACKPSCKTGAHQTPGTNLQAPDTTPSPNPSRGDAGGTVADQGDRVGCAALEMSKILREAGVASLPADPRIRKLAENGVALSTIAAACEQARRSRPAEIIGLPYVLGVLKRWTAEAKTLDIAVPNSLPAVKPEPKPVDVWWTSNAGIERKGRELGLYARGTESHADFKDRIFTEIDKRKG